MTTLESKSNGAQYIECDLPEESFYKRLDEDTDCHP